MDTRSLNKEEKENVLLVLNEFSEEYKANTKSVNGLISTIKEFTGKIDRLFEKEEDQQTGVAPAEAEELKEVVETGIEKIVIAVQRISFPEKEMNQLSGMLDRNIFLLQNPMPQKTIQHHHVPKITWIAGGLFLALSLVSAGWYITANKLNVYVANDTKYRYLKLDTGNIILQKSLYKADNIFNENTGLRDSVLTMEEEYRQNFELLQKASRMSREAENLQTEAKKLKEKANRK